MLSTECGLLIRVLVTVDTDPGVDDTLALYEHYHGSKYSQKMTFYF